MARISWRELVEVLQQHPAYQERWEAEVPADKALYITFGGQRPAGVGSQVFDAADGSHIVLDVSSEGVVTGVEIT